MGDDELEDVVFREGVRAVQSALLPAPAQHYKKQAHRGIGNSAYAGDEEAVYVYVDLSGLSAQDAPRVDAEVTLQVRTSCAPSARLPAPTLPGTQPAPVVAEALCTLCVYITFMRVVTTSTSAERCCAGPGLGRAGAAAAGRARAAGRVGGVVRLLRLPGLCGAAAGAAAWTGCRARPGRRARP